ncbi:MAG: MBL fold metallo-hydrolase, partial [Kiritimatiellae bacterium]|nr:MBL fold metallo-hydrolase [Kiritimatiellia bacterium]
MRITFYGAAHTTTGSMHLVEANGKRILLDCGLYQGHRKEAFEKNRHLPVDPKTIDYVILSHAHIDHSGNIPQLVRQGFRGRIFARQSTTELCDIMLRDSCFLQKRDLEYINKKRRREGKKLFEPLYDESDVDIAMQLFVPTHMHEPRELARGITLEFFNAGHILGSALVQLDIRSDHGHNHRLLFSGDLGQPDQPIIRHYEYPAGADILIVESTYADRYHPSADDVELRLEKYLKYIDRHNSKLLIPAFSVGRTQQIIYYLNRLRRRGKVPREVKVYIDSPLSQKATRIYQNHREVYNDEARAMIAAGENPLEYPGMQFVGTPEESMALNGQEGPMIIIAASGMCEGGRVLHHLKHCVADPDNIILIVGFQAENTLGRRVVEKQNPLRIFGEDVELKAQVEVINALSAHADRAGLMDWIGEVKDNVRHAFAVHGEDDKVAAMEQILKDKGIKNAVAPMPGQTYRFE